MFLPPLARLSQVQEVMDELIAVLGRSLEPASHFKRERGSPENDLKLAVLLHALNSLLAAKAARKLADLDTGYGIMPHVRTLFEALVKVRWLRANAKRATDYLASEPFERYRLATPRVRASDKWAAILRDCEREFAANPHLAKLKNAIGTDGKPNFKKISEGLKMPDLRTMTTEIGMDEEDYMLDQAIPSLYPHSGITHTRNFFKQNNADGTVLLSAETNPWTLMPYASRSLVWIGSIIHEVLALFPDGAVQHDAENVAKRVAELVARLRFAPPLGPRRGRTETNRPRFRVCTPYERGGRGAARILLRWRMQVAEHVLLAEKYNDC